MWSCKAVDMVGNFLKCYKGVFEAAMLCQICMKAVKEKKKKIFSVASDIIIGKNRPALLLTGLSAVQKQLSRYQSPRPARRRNEAFTQFFLEKIAGVQRAAPFGAVRIGPPAA